MNMGIKIVNTLPLQARHDRISLPKFKPIINKNNGWGAISVKPGRTGMWTSTFTPENEEGLSDWYRWCKAEDFLIDKWRWAYVYEVATPLKIIEINSQEDLHALNDEYGLQDPTDLMMKEKYPGWERIRRWPNWERLAREFHAVHLTEEGQWATRLPPSGDDLYGWDCESTLWLQLHRNTFRYVKKVRTAIVSQRLTKRQRVDMRASQLLQMNSWVEEAKKAMPELKATIESIPRRIIRYEE